MKITIIYDNEIYKSGLEADWGFSCLVEVKNTPKILFDTGTKGGILLGNMEKLNIDPGSIDEVFISHAHHDHTGGLSAFLKINKDVTVYIPQSFKKPGIVRKAICVSEPIKIHENVFSTGELSGTEQSLLIKTDKGIVVIAGCSHPGVGTILEAASKTGKVYSLIGGMHGFDEFQLLKNLELICPTHCTQHIHEIKSQYPEKCIDGGAGRVIEI